MCFGSDCSVFSDCGVFSELTVQNPEGELGLGVDLCFRILVCLVIVVCFQTRLSKILKVKKDWVMQLKEMNTQAEKMVSTSVSLTRQVPNKRLTGLFVCEKH